MPATPTGPGPRDPDEPSGRALQEALFGLFRDAAAAREDRTGGNDDPDTVEPVTEDGAVEDDQPEDVEPEPAEAEAEAEAEASVADARDPEADETDIGPPHSGGDETEDVDAEPEPDATEASVADARDPEADETDIGPPHSGGDETEDVDAEPEPDETATDETATLSIFEPEPEPEPSVADARDPEADETDIGPPHSDDAPAEDATLVVPAVELDDPTTAGSTTSDPAATGPAPDAEPEPEPEPEAGPRVADAFGPAAASTGIGPPHSEADPEPAPEPDDGPDLYATAPTGPTPGPDAEPDPTPDAAAAAVALYDRDFVAAEDDTTPPPPGATTPTKDEPAKDRRLLLALAVAVVLTLVAGVGSLLLTRGGDEDAPAATPSPSAPPSTDAAASSEEDLLGRSQASYDAVATAVTETPDLASLPDAAALAVAALPEADAQAAEAAALEPAASEQAVALLGARRGFLAAVAALADLDATGLANFGTLATGLRTAAQQLDEAEVTLELTAQDATSSTTASTTTAALTTTATASDASTATATSAASAVAAAQAADHVTDLVAADAGRKLTEALTSLLGRLEAAGRTAEVRSAISSVGTLTSYAEAARAGFLDDTEEAATVDALLALLDPIAGLGRLDGENLDVWSGTGSRLRTAAGELPEPLATAAQATYSHLDALVASARLTIAAWEREVEAARGAAPTPAPSTDPAYATYARAVEPVLARYRTLLGGLPTLSANGQPDYSQGTRLYDASGQLRSLAQQARGIAVPSGLSGAHQALVGLVEDGQSAAYQGHLTSLEAEQCVGDGGAASACRLGNQRSWPAYSSALAAARRTDAVASGLQTAIASAGRTTAPAPTVTLPPRPEV